VVEDDHDIGRLMQATLVDEGFIVRWVDTGEKALRVLAQGRPELLVLDLSLRGIHGIAVSAAVRDAWPPDVLPIIIVSALPEQAVRATAQASQAMGYLTKPFELSALVELAQRAVAGLSPV